MPVILPVPATAAAAAAATVAAMKGSRRVLIVAAPARTDPRFVEQARTLAAWRSAAADRDLSVVTVVGDAVRGSGDRATALRTRWNLPANGFAAILIGKDGGEKMRSATPIAAETLAGAIDAMPMRRKGER